MVSWRFGIILHCSLNFESINEYECIVWLDLGQIEEHADECNWMFWEFIRRIDEWNCEIIFVVKSIHWLEAFDGFSYHTISLLFRLTVEKSILDYSTKR